MTAPHIPPPAFYSVDEIASLWSCTPTRIRVLAEHGTEAGDKLELRPFTLAGATLEGITAEERRRFEQLTGRDDKPLGGKERKTHLALIGFFATAWAAGTTIEPYTFAGTVRDAAKAEGLDLLRDDETIARVITAALKQIREAKR